MNEESSSAVRVRKLATDYLIQSGMSPVDFARRIGYNHNTLQQYMNGHYAKIASASRIEAAILGFLSENALAPEGTFTGHIYETGAVKLMRNVFTRLLERPQVYMIYAPPGSGKTEIGRHLIAQHNELRGPKAKSFIFRVYCRARISPRDLMKRVATACGTQADTAIDRAIHNLRFDFRGARVVLYFDEAQHLSIDCLEVIRELLDEEPRFSLCFAGSHELDKIFARFAGTLEQLERRISDKVTLPAVTAEEAAGILRSELPSLQLDQAFIRQQIDLATISVNVNRKTQRYISIGRLMAVTRELREGLAAQGAQVAEKGAPGDRSSSQGYQKVEAAA
jgi:DNA transposition AAA+ family ATPase